MGQIEAVSMSVPYMTREQFASHIGLPVGVVEGWVDKGYLPTCRVGKYSLINVALLTRRALDLEFS